MKIDPLHELPPDELGDMILELEESDDVSHRLLDALALSVKNCLAYFFSKYEEHIFDVKDSNDAIYARAWAASQYPLNNGIEVLRAIYSMRDFGDRKSFLDLKTLIFEFAGAVRHYHQEAEFKKAVPLIVGGIKREKQLHAPRDKKNADLMTLAAELVLREPTASPGDLARKVPIGRGRALNKGGSLIYREGLGERDLSIICEYPSGKTFKIRSRAWRGYVQAAKNWHDNS